MRKIADLYGAKEYMKNNIAIFAWSALGDSIIMTVLLKNLKIYFPDSKIYYITGNLIGTHQLKNCPYIDEFISISGFSIRNMIKICYKLLFSKIRYTFTNYTTFQTFFLSRFCLKSEHITIDSGNINKFDKYYDYLIHKTENIVTQPKQFIEYIKNKTDISFNDSLEVFIKYQAQQWYVQEILEQHQATDQDKIIVVHLWWKERWLIDGRNPRCRDNDRWINVFDFILKNYQTKIFFIWGEDIASDTTYIIEKIKDHRLINMVNKLNIEQSAALIKSCGLFLCTDSGPMHVAAALHKKTIALLSDITHKIDDYISDPIRKKNVMDIEAHEVIESIKNIL